MRNQQRESKHANHKNQGSDNPINKICTFVLAFIVLNTMKSKTNYFNENNFPD